MGKLTFPVQWYRNLFSIVDRIFSWVKYFKSWWRLITKTFTKLKCLLSWSILALYLSKSAWFKLFFFFFKSACSKKFPWTNLPFSTTVVEWTLPLSKGAMGHHQNTECKKSHHCWELHPKSWYGLVLLVCFVISSKELWTKRPIYTSFIPWGAVGKKSISFVPHTKMPSALKLKNETRADLIRFRSLPGPERPNTTDAVFLSVFNAYFWIIQENASLFS